MPSHDPAGVRSAERFVAGRAKTQQPDPWMRRITQATDASPQWIETGFRPPHDLRGIDRATDFDLRVYLPGDILTKVDRAAMAHGLETRSPFLDIDLVEFVLSLPPTLRLDRNRTKPLLRDSCRDLWPEAVRNRGKQGFGAPVKDYLARPAVREHWHRVTGENSPLQDILGGAHPYSRSSNPQQRWRLLSLGLWLEQHAKVITRSSPQTTSAPPTPRRTAA